ncbi:chemotaxis protein CheA [Desulfobulbus sp.]|uniref:chemotaxis protein CheA n=1 Tax=Desulfobulbus sp. TaxID=895 RepID=UPI0027BABE70|nr:chemotaxis protein CheA [Desulfobulbus sp.]
MIEEHISTYREEAGELLAELETSLLDLEETPADQDLINRVFRAMHTIKGSGAMFGFDDIAAFTHEVETVFDLVRNGKMVVTKDLLDLTLKSRDHISALLDASAGCGEADQQKGDVLIAGLRRLVPQPAATGGPADKTHELLADTNQPEETQQKTWRIRFQPNRELLLCGSNPVSLINELRSLGSCLVTAHFDAVPLLDALVGEHCYLYWDIILTTVRDEAAIKDVFIFVEDDCQLSIEMIDDLSQDDPTGYKKLGEILVERGDLSPDVLSKVLEQQKPLGEMLVDQGAVTPEKVLSALCEQQHVKGIRQERAAPDSTASIRVPAERLDQLVNLVGEMVTVQARLTQVSNTLGDATFISIAEEVERLTNELRDTALNIRMLPIGSTFSKFKRMVRDLSQELGKEIEMETFGADTEIDKTVIEKLNDPLVHIIRNSIDHGVEKPADRIAAGKPATGAIRLGAEHAGDSVLITIRDDGAGINRDAIRHKAIALGMISPGADLTDQEIYSYIFAPGFSMAAEITNISGRGVGMDVVKRGIEGLRGSIVVDSELGKGTVITLKIPLTLAIIESLLVKIGESHFVLPLGAVEECIELSREDIRAAHGRNLAKVRGHLTPYICLRDQFGIYGARPDIEQIVIVSVQGGRIGFVVDFVVGEHQTVIKPLGVLYQDVKGISGATILGDGSVALIISPGDLARMAETAELAQL